MLKVGGMWKVVFVKIVFVLWRIVWNYNIYLFLLVKYTKWVCLKPEW